MTSIKSVFVGTALLVGLAAPSAFAQAGPAGIWDVVVESPQGAQNVTLELKVTGDKAEGTMTSAVGSMPLAGTVTADAIALTGNLEIQGMALAIGIDAKTAADDIEGSMKFGDFGEFPFKGKRAPAPVAPAAAPSAAAGAAAAAPATDMTGIAGKWNVTLTLEGMGEFPLTANFTQNGEEVTGTLTSMLGEVPIKGTFVGSALKVQFNTETPQGPLTVDVNAELKEQTLTGKASIAGLGEADWKAVRGQ
jgi:hypothetical protein